MPEFALVLAPGQAGAPRELAAALGDELVAAGQRAEVVEGFPPPRDDLVHILVAPRAYYHGEGLAIEPAWQLLTRSAFVCVESPGSPAFDQECFLAGRAGAVFHTSGRAVPQLRRRGLDARHLGLGPTARWTAGGAGARDIDVLVAGAFTHKRAHVVAANAPWLWDRHSVVWLDDESELVDPALLSRAKIFVNLHARDTRYLDWLTVVQAVGAGCAVVSEHALDYEPLVPGEEILLADAANLALVARALLDDEPRREALAKRAQARLEAEQPLSLAAEALAEAAAALAEQPLPPSGRISRFRKPLVELAPPREAPYPSLVTDPESSAIRAALKEARLDLLHLRRSLAAEALRRAGIDPDLVDDAAQSDAYTPATPRVSVVIPLYNHADHIAEALDSAAGSTMAGLELVVTDDGSTDDSAAVVASWIDRNPAIPARLLHHRVNRGLGAARNSAVAQARGDYLLFLDADNVLYPNGIEKLVTALDGDRDAVLGYGVLEMFSADGPVGLRSCLPWRPERFRHSNFVDALALVRRDWLVENGCFTADVRLHGWEDYDLWCRVAEQGRHGVFVPEIIARYRSAPHSMLSLTDLSTRQAVGVLAERHPSLFAGVEPPL